MKSEIKPQLKVEIEDGHEAPQKPSLAKFVYPTNRGNTWALSYLYFLFYLCGVLYIWSLAEILKVKPDLCKLKHWWRLKSDWVKFDQWEMLSNLIGSAYLHVNFEKSNFKFVYNILKCVYRLLTLEILSEILNVKIFLFLRNLQFPSSIRTKYSKTSGLPLVITWA